MSIMTCSERSPMGQLNRSQALTKHKTSPRKPEDENMGPPKAGAYKQRKNLRPTRFRMFYERGDLPVSLDSYALGVRLRWRREIEYLEMSQYLPLFFEGLRETASPYCELATLGVHDLMEHASSRVLPCVPQLIIPIKESLETRHPDVLRRTLQALQHLVLCSEQVGPALVPFYRQLLPVLHLFKNCNSNTGDAIDYRQSKRQSLGDLVNCTLEMLERHGGPDAFINIKYMVPTYESCVLN